MVFSLPHLPSLPSLRNILDPEPQVLYPPSATNTPLPSPSAKARIKNLPPVPDVWARDGERERGRRTSVSSSSSLSKHGLSSTKNGPGSSTANVNGLATSSSSGALARPTHRRAHSAMPLRAAPVSHPVSVSTHVPHGRLTEFSLGKNALASTSALSLPTLAEHESDAPGGLEVEVNHRRRGSRSSITSNTSAMSSLPPSPRRPHASLPNPNPTSVPPPVPRTKRPVLSPRAWSVMDVRPIHEHELEHEHKHTSASTNPTGGEGRIGLTRHQSYTRPCKPSLALPVTARPKLGVVSERRMSSSQVSDVAVLASWHFPGEADAGEASNIGTSTGLGVIGAGGGGGGKPGIARTHSAMPSAGSSRDLADRLRSLAAIDTCPSALSSTATTTTTTTTPTSNLVSRGFQPKLSHRYTHSSPNLNIYATPPGHRRGLRQPTPLGSNPNPNHTLSSSPGSLSLSISTSDTDSSIIEPASPAGSLASQGGRWFSRAWGRRGSSVSIRKDKDIHKDKEEVKVDEIEQGLKGLELRREEEEEDEEDYIDFDRI